MRSPIACIVLSGTILCGSASAGFVTMDFESLRHDDALIVDEGPTYSEDGFTLTADHPEPGNPHRFVSIGTQSTIFTGSTSLAQGVSNGIIILTQSDDLPFNLQSIDLAELPPGANDPDGPFDSGPFDVSFVGTRADASEVSQTFTVTGFLTPETFHFSGFNNVLSVTWTQGEGVNPDGPPGNGSPTHQFDNIVAAEVPEPGSFVLFWMGMMFFGWRRRQS